MALKLILTACFAAVALAGCAAREGYAVNEIAEKANANKEAFMGKEVVVYGYVSGVSPELDKDGYKINLDFDLYSPVERHVTCIVPHGQPTEWLDKKSVTVKGKIIDIHSQNYMGLKSIQLDPCEIVKNN